MNYNEIRRKTRKIKVGSLTLGGDSPILIQSMTNTDTHDVEATYRQTAALEAAGCDIVRITAPDLESIDTFTELRRRMQKFVRQVNKSSLLDEKHPIRGRDRVFFATYQRGRINATSSRKPFPVFSMLCPLPLSQK